jgi:Na+/proline symporter
MSLSASMLSVSWSLVFGVELLYRWGPGGAWLLAIPWLVVLGLFALLAPRLRRFAAFSQGELFGRLYGHRLRWLTVIVLVAVFLTWCGAEIAAAGELLAPLLALSPHVTMAAIAVLVASYAWTGGFRSVVATDVAQFALIVGFLLASGPPGPAGSASRALRLRSSASRFSRTSPGGWPRPTSGFGSPRRPATTRRAARSA